MDEAEVFEPVVGRPIMLWRAWRVEWDPESGIFSLHSVHRPSFWPGNGSYLVAQCLPFRPEQAVDSHNPPYPGKECLCGIYGVKTVKQCRQWAIQGTQFPERLAAIGEVELWGRLWQCDKGIRGQFARPKWLRLLLPTPDGVDAEEVMAELTQLYHVPVHAAPPPWPLQ